MGNLAQIKVNKNDKCLIKEELHSLVHEYFFTNGMVEFNLISYKYEELKNSFFPSTNYPYPYDVTLKNNYELNDFKKKVRDCLRKYGYKYVKFHIRKKKHVYFWWGEEKTDFRHELVSISFDI